MHPNIVVIMHKAAYNK